MRHLTACALLLAAALLLFLPGCNAEGALATTNIPGMWVISFSSPDFPADGRIPDNNAFPANISPALAWQPHVNSITEYVIIVEDRDVPEAKCHWILYNLPAATTSLPEGAATAGNLTQGRNDFNLTAYTGPSSTSKHVYAFQIFGLHEPLGLPPGADLKTLVIALHNKVVAKGRFNAYFP
ncbi:MAG: YbhB/YbcL family Raf kinase inhibitor-like protein [Phycisphaerae bacterium]